ncbi:transglycosylase domain-containing protein [Balneolales bacterium ANBcel1]|nr:transglycosylase domain-containing protein [Balneolales bacterium ANBcel1]
MAKQFDDIDMDRYLNDPGYRREMSRKRKEQAEEELRAKGNSSKAGKAGKKSRKTAKNGSMIGWRHIFFAFGLVIIGGFIAGLLFFSYLAQGLPSVEELENPQTDEASFVMSRDGAALDKFFTENRTYIRYDEISPNVINALIATEDHRFYSHWGIDLYRTLAIPYHLIRGNPQGGSTISQQLARNLYRSIGREVNVTRKLREMITAIQIEQNYTKQEIIEMYLNTVEFSNSTFGIESAALTHFNKPASDLSVSEAATLIGTLQAVSALNPRTRPERSQRRRNVVLSQLSRHGFITEAELQQLRSEPIVLDYNPPFRTGRESRHFGQYVRQQVQSWATENGYDLYRDGLVIHTTIDSRMQRYAEQALRDQLESHQQQFEREWTSEGSDVYMDKLWEEYPGFLESFIAETDRFRRYLSENRGSRQEVIEELKSNEAFVDSVKRARARLEAGFVAIDPSNGNILAWVGGSDYSTIQRDNVYQLRRQTGSTFKPFVYAVAIDHGYRPYHRFSKYPVNFFDASGDRWSPRDPVIPSGPEMMTLREGLGRSLNNVTVRLLPELAGTPGTNRLEDLQPAGERIAEFARNMGINRTPLITRPSIALGTAESSLLELTSAYSTFANMGVHIEPFAVTRIEDSEGNVLQEFRSERQSEVISPETAYIMVDMMRGVIRGGQGWFGTGNRMNWMFNISQDIAGKTGTTQNSADNWFVAMMPHIVAGAWVGGEDRRIRFPQNTQVGQGARTALPIVGQFIQSCANDPNVPWSTSAFEQPQGFVMETPPEDRTEQESRPSRISW